MSAIVPFKKFLEETAAARPEQYADALEAAARQVGITPEAARAEFERMKAHILSYYEGVEPVGSFQDRNGQTIDCVPFEQQPAVRAALAEGRPVARKAPRPPGVAGEPAHHLHVREARPHLLCPEGAVPIVRLTLDRLIRAGTLDNYFRKIPIGAP
jgi:hypothetical protein